MKRILVLCIVAATLLLGCSAEHNQKMETVISGSGATFPQPQVEKWIDSYTSNNPDVKIEYIGKGSGGGQNDFKQRLVDFACSDPPLKESLWKELEKSGQPLQFPIIIGAVVVAYNIPGIDELKLDGKTLADIFMGKIEYWDDARIKELNPNVKLPHEKIVVIHRSDSSGTTQIFTTYLSLVSEEWKEKVGAGKSVSWPVDELGRGVGGKGNQGVVAALKSSPYSICYTELAYVYKENLKTVAIKNKAGKFVKATPETIKAAATKIYVPAPAEGYREDIKSFLNVDGENAYPIVAFSHMIIWSHYADEAKDRAVKNFVRWILTEGQKDENIVQGYVGLPTELAAKLIKEMNLSGGE
ncbi:phosphate ABC transporter substrate-binding protein PstS [Archaeoglobus neptunius]|uniref:phosphate ABC transporter substrate-binding protein PstS n=1 Tax=Archaeoglobus neptunius TaxID=2798580 RepID=UPI0019254F3C|nr:phosphate ABC transporter substrate-binding protein PstS [Archaeoglobus neptunius]